MKKNIIFSLLLIVSLFLMIGCENNNTHSSLNNNIFKIKDVSFEFNQDKEFHDFKYKNAKELTVDESKYSLYLEYVNKEIYDGRFVYRISLSFSDKTNLEKFLSDYKSEKVKINGILWEKVEVNNTTDNKETKAIVYAAEKNSVLYTVIITEFAEANVDIAKLSEVFMNGLSLK